MNSSIYSVLSSPGWLGLILAIAHFAPSPAYCGSDDDGVTHVENLTHKMSNGKDEVNSALLTGYAAPNCSVGHEDTKDSTDSKKCPEESKKEPRGFDNLIQEMNKDWNPCDRSEKRTEELRRGALQVMEDAIAYYQSREPKKIEYSETDINTFAMSKAKHLKGAMLDALIDRQKTEQNKKFYDKMKQMWTELAHEIMQTDESIPTTEKDSAFNKNNYPYKNGDYSGNTIVLPTFQNEFTFTKLSQYFPMGILPVSVKKQELKSLRRTPAHPFLSSFSTGISRFMAHDTAHFYAILEPTFESLDLQNHKRCEQFNACLKRITPNEPFPKELTPAQETQKKKQNAQRIALFDFLHESGLGKFFHYSDIGGSIDRISFHTILENAFQSVLGRKDGKFSFDSFLGDEDDKRKICASLKQLPSLEKEADDSIINRRLESKKLPIVVFDLFPKGKYQQLMTKNKHAIRTVPIQLSGVTFRGEKAHIPHLADEFLLRLKNICEVDFPKGIPPSTDKNNETLEKKLHEAIEKGFPEEVEKNIDQQIEAIHTIQKGLEKTPECKEFFYRK